MAKKVAKNKTAIKKSAPRQADAANPSPRPEEAPENGEDSTAEPAVETKTPEKGATIKKVKRGMGTTVELPSVLVPTLALIVLYLVAYFVAYYSHLDSAMMVIISLATLAYMAGAPVYRNYRQLTKPFAKWIILGGFVFSLVVCVPIVYFAAHFGKPLAGGEIQKGETSEFTLKRSHYRLFLHGAFPKTDQEKEMDGENLKKKEDEETAEEKGEEKKEQKAQPPSRHQEGTFELRLYPAASDSAVDSYKGKFRRDVSRRRVSKRGRGYVLDEETMRFYDLNVRNKGDYRLTINTIGGQLESRMHYGIYPDRQYPYVYLAAFLCIVVSFFFGLIDTLIKPLRQTSYFAPAVGILYGLTFYAAATAMPDAQLDLLKWLTGGIMGGALGYGIYLVSTKLYRRLINRYMLDLSK